MRFWQPGNTLVANCRVCPTCSVTEATLLVPDGRPAELILGLASTTQEWPYPYKRTARPKVRSQGTRDLLSAIRVEWILCRLGLLPNS